MTATMSRLDDTGALVIVAPRRFDFSVHQQFRDAYRDSGGEGMRYRVDLGETEYMDSSALGMLLLLREHAGGDAAQVRLENVSEPVRKVLEIANFHRLFTLA
ncbi:MAG: STAS domain-containing protein [Chromatiales bacterium]|nr:STAS domain-containing protein [Chromatiales bacterium]